MKLFTDHRAISPVHPPCVYVLVDPRRPHAPRYVGSSRALRERLKCHQKWHASRNQAFAAWAEQLAREGVRPALRVVATYASETDARRAEWRLQQRWTRRGVALVSMVVAPAEDFHVQAAGPRARLARSLGEAPWAA